MGRGSGREDWHLLFKIIIIGDAGAGKSCLLHSFLENHNCMYPSRIAASERSLLPIRTEKQRCFGD
jgi:GTPase SAR1 family protein